MPGEWSSEGYPVSIATSFLKSDEPEVAKVAKHFQTHQFSAIAVETERLGTCVWLQTKNDGASIYQQVNWDDPTKNPSDYPEYARNFYGFFGPTIRQYVRAELLAESMKLNLIVKPPREDLISVPSLGFQFSRPTTGFFSKP